MARDDSVFIMGEDVSWNLLGSTGGLLDTFGAERVRDTPISEAGFVGAGAGAAMVGMRPIVDILMAPFLYPAMDQLVSMVAKSTYLSGGQASLPLTIRATVIYAVNNAAQHSDRPWSTFMTIPGLKIVIPSNPYDAKGLLKSAIREDDPVLFFEDVNCWPSNADVPTDVDFTIPFGVASIKREGSDVTIVAIAGAVKHAMTAADQLAEFGISAEVIDPRTIVPLDRKTILDSVAKTGRLIAVDPANETGSVASEIAAIVAEEAFWDLRAPVTRVATPPVHMPYGKSMERSLYPSPEKIVTAAKKLME